MKRFMLPVSAALFLLLAALFRVWGAELPAIRSEAYIVIDAETGQILLEHNSRQREYPASITKILTAALTLEHGGDLDSLVTMTDEAVWSVGRDTTHIALMPGEEVPVRSLLYATMLQSANDAANGLALYTSGDLKEFSRLMNERAREAGALDSHFANAHGLHDPDHYTTAYDMAMITRWALTVDGFREVFGAESYLMPPTNRQAGSRRFDTYHMMIVDSAFTYDGAWGGKLGWTPEAQHTLVTAAERDGMKLICVVMKSPHAHDKFRDTAALLDACFTGYRRVIFSAEELSVPPEPLIEDGKQTGTLLLLPREVGIELPPETDKEEITLDYRFGDPASEAGWAPSVGFLDPDGNELCRVALDYTVDSAVSTGADGFLFSVLRRAGWPVWTLIGISALAAALYARRSYQIAQRRRRRRERLERKRKRIMELAALRAYRHWRPSGTGTAGKKGGGTSWDFPGED